MEARYSAALTSAPSPEALKDQLARLAAARDRLSLLSLSLRFSRDESDRADDSVARDLKTEMTEVESQAEAGQKELARRTAEIETAKGRLAAAQDAFDLAARREREVQTISGTQGERLSILDPGIVPEKRSSPSIPLHVAVGVTVGALVSLLFLTLDFGLREQRRRAATEASWMASRV